MDVCISLNAVASGNQFKLTQVYCFNVCCRLKRPSVSVPSILCVWAAGGEGNVDVRFVARNFYELPSQKHRPFYHGTTDSD